MRECACTGDLRPAMEGWVELTFVWSVRSIVAHCHDFACFQASNPSTFS